LPDKLVEFPFFLSAYTGAKLKGKTVLIWIYFAVPMDNNSGMKQSGPKKPENPSLHWKILGTGPVQSLIPCRA
jgi:hypothetical protein